MTTPPVPPVPPVPEGPGRPDWLTLGAKVGVIDRGYATVARLKKVARFTKTRVVLHDDTWFPLDGLSRRGINHRAELVPTTDPTWIVLRRRQAVAGAVRRLAEAHASWPAHCHPTADQTNELFELAGQLTTKITALEIQLDSLTWQGPEAAGGAG